MSKDVQTPSWIVAVGASAGGYESLLELFSALPEHERFVRDTCFLVMQHSSPGFPSYLSDLLAEHLSIPVVTFLSRPHSRSELLPGQLIVLSSSDTYLFEKNQCVLVEHKEPIVRRARSIDRFFRSVASSFGSRASGIILSGTGHDGSQGCHEIRSMGGYVVVEEPSTAAYGEMPQSVIDSVAFDSVLSSKSILGQLNKILCHRSNLPLSADSFSQKDVKLPTAESRDNLSPVQERIVADLQAPPFPQLISNAESLEKLLSLQGDVTFVFDRNLNIHSIYGDLTLLMKLTEGKMAKSLSCGFSPSFQATFCSLWSVIETVSAPENCQSAVVLLPVPLLLKIHVLAPKQSGLFVLTLRSTPHLNAFSEHGRTFSNQSSWDREKNDILGKALDLQSTNEELRVMNEELESVQYSTQKRILDANRKADHLLNLFRLNGMACLVLDAHLAIVSYVDPHQAFLKIRPSDAGRSLIEVGGVGALNLWEFATQARHIGKSSVKKLRVENAVWTVLAQVQKQPGLEQESVQGISMFLAGEDFLKLWEVQPERSLS